MSEPEANRRDAKGDAARLLLAAARERFSVAASDLLLPEQSRLTEWQRLTAAALLASLVRSIEDPLRAALAPRFGGHEAAQAALASVHVAIALPVLERARALGDSDLLTLLVRRVEEHRFWKAQTSDAGQRHDLLAELVRDPDQQLAGEAMELLIARSRRFDRFHEPVLGRTELPADIQHRLTWLIAAALRHYLVQQHRLPSGAVDLAIEESARGVLQGYDEGDGLEARAMRLARRLHRAARLEGPVLARVLEEGNLPLFVAGAAVHCGLDHGAAWEILSDPRGRGPALLLRAAGIERGDAARILLVLNSKGRLFSGAEGDATAAQLDLFDATARAAALEVLRLWQADPAYRGAVARLSTRARPVPEAA
ncbi:MAG: DUF2336 domain-containing protein [Allosphingosinicella sp.]|uniref:DUF2336 domain-containing protein n=1 Tax=Allosphingosinicella sp. TaxID=2823234 RepID=UPI00393B5F1E